MELTEEQIEEIVDRVVEKLTEHMPQGMIRRMLMMRDRQNEQYNRLQQLQERRGR